MASLPVDSLQGAASFGIFLLLSVQPFHYYGMPSTHKPGRSLTRAPAAAAGGADIIMLTIDCHEDYLKTSCKQLESPISMLAEASPADRSPWTMPLSCRYDMPAEISSATDSTVVILAGPLEQERNQSLLTASCVGDPLST